MDAKNAIATLIVCCGLALFLPLAFKACPDVYLNINIRLEVKDNDPNS